jgi:hypothetical protein
LKIKIPNATHIKKKPLGFIILCLIFFGCQVNEMRETSLRFFDKDGIEHTLSLPLKDKKSLFVFMHMLFAKDNFAYTLLGSKPVSWACYKNLLPFDDCAMFYHTLKKYHSDLRRGWKTWLKYRHLFASTFFWAENSESRSESHSGWVSILLVNEEQFNRVVLSNKKDFQDVLNREVVDGFQLLREAKNDPLMGGVLKGHQALMGIVLGYGRDNSWEFLKGIDTHNLLGCVWDETNDGQTGAIKTRLGGITIEECLSLDSCPSFAGIPHSEESLELKRDYLLTQQKVINYYKGKDFLEATLSLLAGFRPE